MEIRKKKDWEIVINRLVGIVCVLWASVVCCAFFFLFSVDAKEQPPFEVGMVSLWM